MVGDKVRRRRGSGGGRGQGGGGQHGGRRGGRRARGASLGSRILGSQGGTFHRGMSGSSESSLAVAIGGACEEDAPLKEGAMELGAMCLLPPNGSCLAGLSSTLNWKNRITQNRLLLYAFLISLRLHTSETPSTFVRQESSLRLPPP